MRPQATGMRKGSVFRTLKSDYRRLFRLVRPYRRRIGVLAGTSFLTGTVEAAFLVLVTRLALAISENRVRILFIGETRISVKIGLAIAGALVAFRLLLALVSSVQSTILVEVARQDMRARIATSFLTSNWATQQNEPSGRLLQLVTSFVDRAVEMISAFATTISTILSLAAMLTVTIIVKPLASIAVILALVLLMSMLSPIRRSLRTGARKNARAQMEYSTAVSELGAMGLEMQTFGVTDEFAGHIEGMSRQITRSARRVAILRASMPHIFVSLAFGTIVVILYVLSFSRAREISSIGAVMIVLLRSLTFGQQLQRNSGSLASATPFLDELDETYERYATNSATRGTHLVADVGHIRVSNLSFSYSEERPVLTDVSFDITPGEIVGIIGPSGSGKSTLVQLLLGLREPSQGSITVGGVPLTDVERSSWSRLISFVPQDPHLVTGTVTENICFFRSGIDIDEVQRAARLANVLDDIASLPDGFDTHLGQRGVQLSGGQRQRMSIARALVGHPKLLILDEPTSALDVRSESLIRDTLSDLRGDVTVIVIAHRLSTLDMCDRLMVIESGHMAAFDTPERLRSDSDFYRQALAMSGLA